MPSLPLQQKQYRDRSGNLIKCPRCGSDKITTSFAGSRSVDSGSLGKNYYCKSCARVFTFGGIKHRKEPTLSPSDLLKFYLRFSKGLLAWSSRYSSWFYRLDKDLPWQRLDKESLTNEVRMYLAQNHGKFKSKFNDNFIKRCIYYLKDNLQEEINPDPFTYSLGHPKCKHCGASHTMSKGKTPKGRRKYYCVNCGRSFNIIPSPSLPTNSTNDQKT